MEPRRQESIQACLDCHRACLEAMTYLQASDGRVEASHIRLLLNTAEVCQTSANLLRGGLDVMGRACALCADLCQRCATYCERFGDDPVMRRCAEVCRRCAAACREATVMAA